MVGARLCRQAINDVLAQALGSNDSAPQLQSFPRGMRQIHMI